MSSRNESQYSLSSCMQCGTCSAGCVSRESFNLRILVMNTMMENLSEESLWDCTTCLTCQIRCPRGIPLKDAIVDYRKKFVELGRIPPEIRDMLNSVQKFRNPFGEPHHNRRSWISLLKKNKEIKSIEEDFEWLWYIGCFGADHRSRQVFEKTAEIFQSMELDFAVTEDEGCCGNDVLGVGEEGLFELLKEENESLFRKYGINKVITSSPHCYNVFKNYYDVDAITAIELLYHGIKNGSVEFSYDVEAKVTFHDPCYLGRYNGIYEIPRKVIEAIYNIELVEMPRNRVNSFCCGGGSGNFLREGDLRPNVLRVKEAISTGADILAVACPVCLNMLEDGVKTVNSDLEVMDIMEIVHLAMFGE